MTPNQFKDTKMKTINLLHPELTIIRQVGRHFRGYHFEVGTTRKDLCSLFGFGFEYLSLETPQS